MFTYKIYGLIIGSDVEIKELVSANQVSKIDATISFALVPRYIENPVYDGENVKYSRCEFYLHIKGLAHYYVAHGKKILVQLEDKAKLSEVKVYLLGSCLGILLSQRKTVAMHGGAVVIDGACIIITGEPAVGKSALVSAFIKADYKYLADDVVALEKDERNNIIAFPAFPQQKLCKDVIEKMGFEIDGLTLIDKEREKFAIPSEYNFLPEALPLKAIYEINIVDVENVSIEELFGTPKLILILKNIYRIKTISLENLDPVYFKKCVDIAKNIKVYKLYRPKNRFSLDEQVKLIKDTLG